ncbi:MAG: HelD family protein [Bacilli bacterium]
MNLSPQDLTLENKHLDDTLRVIREKLSSLGQELYDDNDKILEFKKYIWDTKAELDPTEMRSMMAESDFDVYLMSKKGSYFKKLYKIQNNPYFGSIIFESDDAREENIYIGITYVSDNMNYLVHDWRSPIASLFYDYEVGKASYLAPSGLINGNLKRKRQYKIENGKFVHIFDNSINIDDELLQEVLASSSSSKMKNIVNTIQMEQNKIIRNTSDKNLVVQGIAGSGKTSVALHRIAFLLYKIKNLTSSNVLIFSPNRIFSEYISNVLPELGEENTLETTFHKFLESSIYEYKEIESFTDFISRYYKYNVDNVDLVIYKQSDEIINNINLYIDYLVNKAMFVKEVVIDKYVTYDVEDLNYMLKDRYSKFPLFERINAISIKISENEYRGNKTKAKSIRRLLLEALNIDCDYKKIYMDFYRSNFCTFLNLSDSEIVNFVNKKKLNYEDACLFAYMKGLLNGFDYNVNILQVVVDEAQDYTKLQYIILSKIFKKASFTILGDVNQTINPYYKYNSLEEICEIFNVKSRYLELTKTYRSSENIINYINNILGLNYVVAIRKGDNKEVISRCENDNLKEMLLADINYLKNIGKSIAIITKNDSEAEYLYELLSNEVMGLELLSSNSYNFKRDLVIVPSYVAKGLEFDSVIVYTKPNNRYKENEKYLFYVACSRAQHQLIVYNN